MTGVTSEKTSIVSRWRAPALMLAAAAVFSLMDAGLKLLSPHYSAFQIAALRGAASLPLVLVWALVTVGPWALLRVRWPLHLLRGVLGVLMMVAFVYAVRELPLSTTYAIFFVAPLLIAALSVPVLRERVGPRRWAAILIGFIGVLVVLRPSTQGMLSLAGIAVLLAAMGYAISAITVRVLSRTDSSQAMVVWVLTAMALGAGVLAWPQWQPLQAGHIWLIVGVGIAGALGQYLITEAFRHGEASKIAPLEYSAMLWAVILDYSVWRALPDAMTWVGAGIIIASGLYLLRRERVHVEAEHP